MEQNSHGLNKNDELLLEKSQGQSKNNELLAINPNFNDRQINDCKSEQK